MHAYEFENALFTMIAAMPTATPPTTTECPLTNIKAAAKQSEV